MFLPGDVGALPVELKRSSALSTADPDNQAAGLASASQSADSAGDSASDRAADGVVSSSSLLAGRIAAEDAQAAGGSAGAGGADPAIGLDSGRSSGANGRASSDAIMARRSDEQLDSVTDAGGADLNSADLAAREDGVQATARTGSQRGQLPQKTSPTREAERAARQSAERAADAQAALGQGAGAAHDALRRTDTGASAAGGSAATDSQDSGLPGADEAAGSIGASAGVQRLRAGDSITAGQDGSTKHAALRIQSADVSTGQALSSISGDPQSSRLSSQAQAARL